MTLDASRRCTRPLAMFAGSRSAAPQFVIYKSPADYPGKFVVRMWRTHKPADVRFLETKQKSCARSELYRL
jgi:hypothetical protein